MRRTREVFLTEYNKDSMTFTNVNFKDSAKTYKGMPTCAMVDLKPNNRTNRIRLRNCETFQISEDILTLHFNNPFNETELSYLTKIIFAKIEVHNGWMWVDIHVNLRHQELQYLKDLEKHLQSMELSPLT